MPGGPCISATSEAAKAWRMAACWEVSSRVLRHAGAGPVAGDNSSSSSTSSACQLWHSTITGGGDNRNCLPFMWDLDINNRVK